MEPVLKSGGLRSQVATCSDLTEMTPSEEDARAGREGKDLGPARTHLQAEPGPEEEYEFLKSSYEDRARAAF